MRTEMPVAPASTLAARPKRPYPGLRPFKAEEWSIFFGREHMIDDIIDRLAIRRLVLIHGASGAGKSSLVRAGVLPKLAHQHLRVGETWQTCEIRPSGGPLWNLATEFANLEGSAGNLDRIGQIIGQFNQKAAKLSTIVASLDGVKGRRFCILIDQFEELFRFEKEYSREEAELFVDLLVRNVDEAADISDGAIAPEQFPSVHIVVTMRSEFLGDCSRFDGLAEAINRTQYLVPRMDRDSLLRAIRRPASLYGAEVSLDLAERLIAEVGGREDELPLIQHGLMFLWNAATERSKPCDKIVLNAAPLDAAGGLARLLSSHVDSVVKKVAPDAERDYGVERLFCALTDLNVEGRGIRRPQSFRDLVNLTEIGEENFRIIIDALRADSNSFLTPYAPTPISEQTEIDISHEALIRCWTRLADRQDGWLRREFDDGQIWRSLLVQAEAFKSDKRCILSPATTDERERWWQERKVNSFWAERYGGNFALVSALMNESRRDARRKRQRRQALFGMLPLVGGAGVIYTVWANWLNLELFADLHLWHTVLSRETESGLSPKTTFQECTRCPKMVVVPAGRFEKSASSESSNTTTSTTRHSGQFASIRRVAISETEVTFREWDACFRHGGCLNAADNHWGRGDRPVIRVSWDDAKLFVTWLSRITKKRYRLLTETEWEYSARAGSASIYYWGTNPKMDGTAMANCADCGSPWGGKQTAPVKSFDANAFGLYDMLGNVWEWLEDCWTEDGNQLPVDGSAWTGSSCNYRVTRGGSWYARFSELDWRDKGPTELQATSVGFRVAREISP